jgi:hypothetical protein
MIRSRSDLLIDVKMSSIRWGVAAANPATAPKEQSVADWKSL